VEPTDIGSPEYFHKVVDCQWACPAHTPVPEYIRLISAGRYNDAYMINWASNVFPGILGRTCDRPCEPACRRGRVEEQNLDSPQPVAICRLKRVAADNKTDVKRLMPIAPQTLNGKKVLCIGAGPASLTVARDLAPLGYAVTVFDRDKKSAGMIRSQIPRFRLPEEIIDEEVGYVEDLGVEIIQDTEVHSMRDVLSGDFDAVFVGTGAPRGKDISIPGRVEVSKHVHIGIDWLSSVSFGHIEAIKKRVLVLGGGNTAMDCCRTAKRLGGEDVRVIVRSGFDDMKASPWEKEDAMDEGIPIHDYLVPKEFLHDGETLIGMSFQKVRAEFDSKGRRSLIPTGAPDEIFDCDEVLVAIGQENAFPWIEEECGIEFDQWGLPRLNEATFQSTNPQVFFGGDSALGPKNIIWAVAHGHEAAISIDRFCNGSDLMDRPAPIVNLVSQKMGIHEWTYDNDVSQLPRHRVPLVEKKIALKDIKVEVEVGFDQKLAFEEAQRCLNCDVQTVFTPPLCIECDACVDICPTDCITFTDNGDEMDLRQRLKAPAKNLDQSIYVSSSLKTGRIMAKDEDVCLHCGLCAERCPTGAWDMRKFYLQTAKAGHACQK
jgi:formate dehydrogenase beta subunit